MSAPLCAVDLGRIFWLRTDKANLKGLCPVSLRLTLRGHRHAEVSTGVRCRPADWAGTGKNGPLKKSHPEYSLDSHSLATLHLNVKIATKRLEAFGLVVSPLAVAQLLKNPAALVPQPDPCLLAFMETELTEHYALGNRATYESLRSIVGKLRSWHGSKPLPLTALPAERAIKFYQHLLANKARGGEVRSANKVINNLSLFFRRGVKQMKWPASANPFACIAKKSPAKLQKVRLTQTEHRQIVAAALPPASRLWRARAAWLLQFYLRGERVGACLLLRWSDLHQNDTCIRYQAQKGGPFKQVPVRPELAALLAALAPRRAQGHVFLLPYVANSYDKMSPTQQLQQIKNAIVSINKALKAIAKQLGIDKPLRSHAARHTFATIAAKAVGVRAVQQFLGHTTEKMTQVYLADFDHDELDAAADAAFDSI